MNWRQDAACREEDPDLFFPVGTTGPAVTQTEDAKSVCRRCPVMEQCLRWAMNSGQEYGVWGATSEKDRQAIRAGRRQYATSAH
ncbi:WhiB family redox-sensing transcriptional regulator [Streptomyces netropsis]|uniref:Transcriptional regulator WhiB n=1 Tax=Streptomyces netropsis TaxID=55404 RepID=A0A7W7LG74_STRNE|nr:WhiB family transcriptional regulator [Streptomyces netropsis]MBB4889602.1 WhiB family redox-sensing transcriptional regulator [Streptomyces netropsis]